MRIALIDPSLFTWPYDQELANALAAGGHDVRLIGKMLPPDDPQSRDPILQQHFYPRMATPAWSRVPAPAFRVAKGLSHITSMARLVRLLSEWAPDVIHFQWLPLPIVDGLFLPALRRIAPLVLTVHDTMPFNGAPGPSLQMMGALRMFRAFDRLIVHTQQGRDRVSLHVGSSEHIARIPHGLLHDQASTASSTTARTGPNGEMTFLLFGKIRPYKGVDVLIRALGRLSPSARAKCRVRIIGKPYMDTEPLLRLVQEMKVADLIDFQFRFVSDDELTRTLDDASVLIFPYREIEASGVLMAAVAHGRPVIASRLGLFGEMIVDGEQGLLVPPGDAPALADALERIIDDPALLPRLAAGMDELRTSIPHWADIAGRTVTIYETARHDWRRHRRVSTTLDGGERRSPLTRQP